MNKGFTLIELLVVVLIIGILSAVALPQYRKAVEKTKATLVYSNMRAIARALEAYRLETGAYPSDTLDGVIIDLSGCEIASTGRLFCEDSWYDYNGKPDWTSALEVQGYTKAYNGESTVFTELHYYLETGTTACRSGVPGVCQSLGFVD